MPCTNIRLPRARPWDDYQATLVQELPGWKELTKENPTWKFTPADVIESSVNTYLDYGLDPELTNRFDPRDRLGRDITSKSSNPYRATGLWSVPVCIPERNSDPDNWRFDGMRATVGFNVFIQSLAAPDDRAYTNGQGPGMQVNVFFSSSCR